MNTYLQYATRNSTIHVLSYGLATGATIWHSFVGGPVAYKTIPRQQFGYLQGRLAPPFFALQTVCGGLMLYTASKSATATYNDLITSGTTLVAGLVNLLVLAPWTTKVMDTRHRLERATGTKYTDPQETLSGEMRDLNRKFAVVHGLSSIVDMAAVVALLLHTVQLGHKLDLIEPY